MIEATIAPEPTTRAGGELGVVPETTCFVCSGPVVESGFELVTAEETWVYCVCCFNRLHGTPETFGQ